MRLAVVVLVIVAPSFAATAQTPAFGGVVTDEAGRPLPGVLVSFYELGRLVLSDANGRFQLPSLPAEDVLTLAAPGHARSSFAVVPGETVGPFVLPHLEGVTRSLPFSGQVTFPADVRLFSVGTMNVVESVPFAVEPGANGGLVKLAWSPNDTRLMVNVVHVASGASAGFFHGVSPLEVPLPGVLLRDLPGSYQLELSVYDGPAVGLNVDVQGVVDYGPWVTKAVLGKRPEVSDAAGDRDPGRSWNPDMDITAVRFTNETAEQLDVEMDLARLTQLTSSGAGENAYWSVHWTFGGTHWALFLDGSAPEGPQWYAGTCAASLAPVGLPVEPSQTSCTIDHKLYGGLLRGIPGRVTWHVPKAVIGNPPDGEALEGPLGINFQVATDRTPARRLPLEMDTVLRSDDTAPGRPYVFGVDQYALPPGTVDALRASATLGSGAPSGLGLLLPGLGAVVLASGGLAWTLRRRARQPGGRYQQVRLLGQGASGRTFLARDRASGALVAIKQCAPSADGPAARARLRREAHIAQRLAHPHVVRVLDLQEGAEGDALVMEYVAGGSLEARLRGAPLSFHQALRIWHDVLAGLAAIHAAGIVHRDVKPSNILLAEDGTAKVADFGVARSIAEETLGGGGPVGTPMFMAPETLQGREPSVRSDLYAATAVAYRLLAGRPHRAAAAATSWDALLARRRGAAALPIPGQPPWLNDLLLRGLADDPRKRPKSAQEMLAVLDAHGVGREEASRALPRP